MQQCECGGGALVCKSTSHRLSREIHCAPDFPIWFLRLLMYVSSVKYLKSFFGTVSECTQHGIIDISPTTLSAHSPSRVFFVSSRRAGGKHCCCVCLYVRSPCLVDPQVNAKFRLPCLQQNLAIIYSYAATSSKNLWPTGECAFNIQFRRRRRDSPSMSRGHKNTKNECETRLLRFICTSRGLRKVELRDPATDESTVSARAHA